MPVKYEPEKQIKGIYKSKDMKYLPELLLANFIVK